MGMSGGNGRKRKRRWAVAAFSVLVLTAIASAPPSRLFPASACRVVRYYKVLDESGVRTGPLEKLVFSLILSSAEKTKARSLKQPVGQLPNLPRAA